MTQNTLDPELLNILICPLTRSKLRLEGDELVAETGGLRYPIRDGIPVLLIEEAALPEGVATLDEFKSKFKDQIPN
ncbi:MAG: Trm112 family protein [Phycisphaeraceae bacterium]